MLVDACDPMLCPTRGFRYTIVNNRTLTDRQLEQLRREKTIRVFKLGSQADEMAIMLRKGELSPVSGERR